MNKSDKYSPEVKERAVRLVQEARKDYPSQWSAFESIAPKIGCEQSYFALPIYLIFSLDRTISARYAKSICATFTPAR